MTATDESDGSNMQPQDSTLGGLIFSYEDVGFTGQMAPRPDGRVICFACKGESDASEMDLFGLKRMEGASDPDDMLAVAALTCPNCGTKGTVTLGYGPESDPDDADVLVRLETAKGTP